MKFLKTLVDPFVLLYKYRNLLWQTTKNDVRTRFAGSVLGLLWLFFYPLLLLGAYAAVYIFVFKVKFQLFNTNEYVVLIFCGLIPFLGFAEALGMGVGSVVSNSNLIKNTLFPIEMVPVKSVFASQCTQVAGMLMLIVVIGLIGRFSVWLPLFIVIWLLQLMFSVGIIWILSSLNVFARDLQNIVSVLVLFLMMISPIAYTDEMIPPEMRSFIRLNPLYYLIISYQDIMMLGQFPRGNIFWDLVILSFFTFIFGYWFFKKMKQVFADNV